jgi:phospholipase C
MPPPDFTYKEGATAMGFYNVQQGDVPYFKQLADTYSMSDNFHQSVEGGTGANHVMLGTGDAIWFSDGNGNPAVPPEGVSPVPMTSPQLRGCQRDRKSESAANSAHQQLVYPGRLRRRYLQRVRRHFAAGCRGDRRLSDGGQGEPELRSRPLLLSAE